ncbi:MAG: hypothetical protein ACJ8CB_16990, partial [Ktedonobacteraceae bacterium]
QPVPFVAGQFVFVRFGGGHGWEPHPFTISSAPQESLLHLSIKGRGDETQRLIDTLQPGIPARVGRAFGMFDHRRGGHQQVWIAGGIGITPFRSWIRAFPTEQPLEFDIDFYYTVRTEDEALFLDEIRTAAAHSPTFRPHITYSKREGSLTMEQRVSIILYVSFTKVNKIVEIGFISNVGSIVEMICEWEILILYNNCIPVLLHDMPVPEHRDQVTQYTISGL